MLTPVFLSYARFDESAAQSIRTKIKGWGIDIWMDKYEIDPGDNWPEKSMKALDRAQIVLLLISPDWLLHDGFVKDEFYRALSNWEHKGTHIIPLLLNVKNPPVELTELHAIQWTDKQECEKLRIKLIQFRRTRIMRLTAVSLGGSFLLLLLTYFIYQTVNSTNAETSLGKDSLLQENYSSAAVAPKQKSRFDAWVFDAATKQPLSGATAFIMRNKAELMIRSAPSDSTGYIFAVADTLPDTNLPVTISCPGYESHSTHYMMKSNFYAKRKISLNRSVKKKTP